VWRHKKPEFWNAKKAYSPVRLLLDEIKSDSEKIIIPVYNRFDHTWLNEIKATLTMGGKTTALQLPAIAPHEKGFITIRRTISKKRQYTDIVHSAGRLLQEPPIFIRFMDKQNGLIDEEKISAEPVIVGLPDSFTQTCRTETTAEGLLLHGYDFTVRIEKNTWAIRDMAVTGKTIISGSPTFVVNKPDTINLVTNTVGIFSDRFISRRDSLNADSNAYALTTRGIVSSFPSSSKGYPVELTTKFFANGLVEIHYRADSIPPFTWDIGIGIPVPDYMDHIEWVRKSYWTTYPEDHISATEGAAQKGSDSYHAKKENIYCYTISDASGHSFSVLSDGSQSVKMNKLPDGSQQLLISDKWDYWSLSWGNYQGTKNTKTKIAGTVYLLLK
jgi:hypothetical protein